MPAGREYNADCEAFLFCVVFAFLLCSDVPSSFCKHVIRMCLFSFPFLVSILSVLVGTLTLLCNFFVYC